MKIELVNFIFKRHQLKRADKVLNKINNKNCSNKSIQKIVDDRENLLENGNKKTNRQILFDFILYRQIDTYYVNYCGEIYILSFNTISHSYCNSFAISTSININCIYYKIY